MIEEVRMMDCLHPTAPDDEKLLRFALDGEALSVEASRHLEECFTCRQRLASYKRTHTFLVSRLYRSQCPDSTRLSLYCADLLPRDERLSIAQHVQACPLCAAEAVDARQFLMQMDRDLLPSPSLSLDGLHATVRRIFASLVKQQAQLGVRSDAHESTWPRHYKAEAVDLSLHLSHIRSREHMLLGILTSTNASEDVEALEGVPAELYTGPWSVTVNSDKPEAVPLLRTRADDMGNIVFKTVPAGEYVMLIQLPGREVVIEGLTIEQT